MLLVKKKKCSWVWRPRFEECLRYLPMDHCASRRRWWLVSSFVQPQSRILCGCLQSTRQLFYQDTWDGDMDLFFFLREFRNPEKRRDVKTPWPYNFWEKTLPLNERTSGWNRRISEAARVGYPPVKTNIAGWKSTFSNRRYIYIHGGFSSQLC